MSKRPFIQFARGVSRFTVLLGPWAFKFPIILYTWRQFLQGMLANDVEANFTTWGHPYLCPVVFSLPFGLLAVMPRAETLQDELPGFLVDDKQYQQIKDMVEMKPDSWGYVKGKLMAVDYGN